MRNVRRDSSRSSKIVRTTARSARTRSPVEDELQKLTDSEVHAIDEPMAKKEVEILAI